MEKVALVLEGGGFRGCYTAGALKWLNDHHIVPEYTVGISATALYAFYFLTDRPQELYDISVVAVTDPHMVGFQAILSEGAPVGYNYMAEHYCFPTYKEALKDLRESDAEFEMGIYNCTQDCLQYKNKWDMDEEGQMLKAACVLPLSNRMTEVNGEKYLDGGIDTMVAVERAKEKGYDRILCIVTKDKDYVRKPNGKFTSLLLHTIYHKNTHMLELLDHRVEAYNRQMNAIYQLEEEGRGMLFRPTRDCGVTRFSGTREQLDDMFLLGWQDMEDRKSELYQFLGIEEK